MGSKNKEGEEIVEAPKQTDRTWPLGIIRET